MNLLNDLNLSLTDGGFRLNDDKRK